MLRTWPGAQQTVAKAPVGPVHTQPSEPPACLPCLGPEPPYSPPPGSPQMPLRASSLYPQVSPCPLLGHHLPLRFTEAQGLSALALTAPRMLSTLVVGACSQAVSYDHDSKWRHCHPDAQAGASVCTISLWGAVPILHLGKPRLPFELRSPEPTCPPQWVLGVTLRSQ